VSKNLISLSLLWIANAGSVLFNDNGIFEYILQDDVFMGVIGMLECEYALVFSFTCSRAN